MRKKALGVYWTVFMFVFLCISCGNKRKEEITLLVEHWKDKIIIFPVAPIFIQDRDTVNCSLETQYKILSYVDSTGCVSCKLKLAEWKKFIDVVDSVNPSVKVLFFFSPGKIKDVYRALYKSHFNSPVCIDLKDSLNKLNHFPSNMAFQTFLLNSDNRALAIGNPINNPKIKELYLSIVQGKEIQRNNENSIFQTKVSVDKVSISLGNFDWRIEQKSNFIIKNRGNNPLVIEDVNSSCGCTSVTYSKEPIQPNKELILAVTYKAEQLEHFNKTITVYCNVENSPIILRISGNAK